MKAIKITERNRKRIQACLDQAQNRCRVRLVSVNQIFRIAREADETLAEMRIPKCHRVGALVTEVEPVTTKAYRAMGIPRSTRVELKRSTTGWSLVEVERAYSPMSGPERRIYLPGPAREAIVRGTMRAFNARSRLDRPEPDGPGDEPRP